ncbi:MAG: VOC family protein [Candidatus Velthaea sp.]|jgi:predicted 3-demethylubiquinone-9 3-methyltransferase (glyoxalase superfamily)
MAHKIAPCLWFDGNAEEAAGFNARTFAGSRIDAIHRSPSDYPSGKEGDVLTVEFTVLGMRMGAMMQQTKKIDIATIEAALQGEEPYPKVSS